MRKFSIGVRLTFAFMLVTAAFVAVGFFALSRLAQLDQGLDEVARQRLRSLEMAIRGLHVTAQQANHVGVMLSTDDPAEALRRMETIVELRKEAQRANEEGDKLAAMEGGITVVDNERTKQVLAELAVRRAHLGKTFQKTLETARTLNLAETKRVTRDDLVPALTAVEFGWSDYTKAQGAQMQEAAEAGHAMYESARVLVVGVLLSTAVLAIVLSFWVTRTIVLPLGSAVKAADRIAAGDLRESVESFGVPFVHVPNSRDTRAQAEARMLELLEGKADLVVLARYMQIVSPELVARWPNRIINIHHSFLPAFVGADPYRQAYERGVKIVGATAHYVTAELDAGPIIDQDVGRVSHRDAVEDLKRLGRDLERRVLARAVRWHCEDRVIVNGNKTVVFG